jgi:hypothetical protein
MAVEARMAGPDMSWMVRQGMAGVDWWGWARRGMACQGMAGVAGKAGWGASGRGRAGQGKAWRGRNVLLNFINQSE